MQINLACKIPNDLYLACSGGVDSMVVLDFLLNSKRRPKLIYFNHNTIHGQEAEIFVRRKAQEFQLDLTVCRLVESKDPLLSPEEFWRQERYKEFFALDIPVITAHHLDDAVEWWLMSAMHGYPKLIPVHNKNIIRPFLLTKKSDIKKWAEDKSVEYIEDPSNVSRAHMRNIVRHDMMPHVLKINPGIYTTVKKQYDKQTVKKQYDKQT